MLKVNCYLLNVSSSDFFKITDKTILYIMIVTIVNVRVKKEHINDFIRASKENHKGSITETGNLRFDVIQNAEEPGRFILYEAYESEEAAVKHKETPHYLKWRETVAGWMAEPRQGIKHKVICLHKM